MVQGAVVVNGTSGDVIIFTSMTQGVSSGATIFKFIGTNLLLSQMSHIKMEYAAWAIRVGDETEHNQGGKNTGTLTASYIDIVDADIMTKGYDTSAKLVLSDVTLDSITVQGAYPRSEPIDIINATIIDSTINSDAYNKGIKLVNADADNTVFSIGCCGANIKIEDSTISDSIVQNGSGSPVTGPFELIGSEVINTSIELPEATVNIINSMIKYNGSRGVRFGIGQITGSSITGNGTGTGLEVTGYSGYNIGGSITISGSTITNNAVGVKVTNANVITIQNSNIFNNINYNIENLSAKTITASNNYWGTVDSLEIEASIYDYTDNINFGDINFTGYLNSVNADAPVASPVYVSKISATGGIQLSWAANKETDIAGYLIYYGTTSGITFSNVINAGNVTGYFLPGLSIADIVAVSAYDHDADGTNDRTEGHESGITYAGNPAPGIKLSPYAISFGAVKTGQGGQQTLNVYNPGTGNLVVSGIVSSNNLFTLNPTTFTVLPGASRSVTVTFSPNALGLQNGTLSLNHNVSSIPATVSLTGIGVQIAGASVNGVILSNTTGERVVVHIYTNW